jgi:hypothetical protein
MIGGIVGISTGPPGLGSMHQQIATKTVERIGLFPVGGEDLELLSGVASAFQNSKRKRGVLSLWKRRVQVV